MGYRLWPLAAAAVLGLNALTYGEEAPERPTYAKPPAREVWIEGEDCTGHNWSGVARNFWVYDYTPVHGATLDLAAAHLPQDGPFKASFPFELAEDGTYILYFLGRVPGYLASPITWQIDGGPEHREPAEKPNSADEGHALDLVMNWRYALVRLGEFEASAGKHRVTIRVREPAEDRGRTYFSQQIDALLISRAADTVKPASPPRPPKTRPETVGPKDEKSAAGIRTESGALSMELSPVHGGIRHVSLSAGDKKLPVAASSSAQPLVSVTYLSGRKVWADLTWEESRRFHGADADVEIDGAFAPGEPGRATLDVSIVNRADEAICEVAFLPLNGIALGGNAGDDTYIIGADRFEPGSPGLRERHTKRSPQLRFDWVCVTDADAALFAYFKDKALLDTDVTYSVNGPAGTLRFSKHPRILPGQRWQAPTLVIGAFPEGDWHKAADEFSAWWHSWAKRPVVPDWVKSVGGLTLNYKLLADDPAAQAEQMANDLDALRTTRDASGIFFAHTTGWLVHPFLTEAWFPHSYKLSPERLRQFRAATDTLRGAGGRVSVYTNPLMFSRVIPEYDDYGHALPAIGKDGTPWLTEHTHRHHPMILPYPSAKWARHYLEYVEPMVEKGRPDCLYMDQLGAIPGHLDFAPGKNGHTHYGEWVHGSVEFVRTLEERLRPKRPELVTMIECPCPAIQQYVTLGLLGGNDVLRYAFPYYPNVHGPYATIEPQEALECARESFRCAMVVLLTQGTIAKMDDAMRGEVKSIVELKQAVDPLLFDARFMDTVGVEAPGHCRAGVFTAADSKQIFVAIVNPGKAAGAECIIHTANPPSGCEVMTADSIGTWTAVEVRYNAGRVRVPVPGASASLVRLRGVTPAARN